MQAIGTKYGVNPKTVGDFLLQIPDFLIGDLLLTIPSLKRGMQERPEDFHGYPTAGYMDDGYRTIEYTLIQSREATFLFYQITENYAVTTAPLTNPVGSGNGHPCKSCTGVNDDIDAFARNRVDCSASEFMQGHATLKETFTKLAFGSAVAHTQSVAIALDQTFTDAPVEMPTFSTFPYKSHPIVGNIDFGNFLMTNTSEYARYRFCVLIDFDYRNPVVYVIEFNGSSRLVKAKGNIPVSDETMLPGQTEQNSVVVLLMGSAIKFVSADKCDIYGMKSAFKANVRQIDTKAAVAGLCFNETVESSNAQVNLNMAENMLKVSCRPAA